jgi:hypothetical protein
MRTLRKPQEGRDDARKYAEARHFRRGSGEHAARNLDRVVTIAKLASER